MAPRSWRHETLLTVLVMIGLVVVLTSRGEKLINDQPVAEPKADQLLLPTLPPEQVES